MKEAIRLKSKVRRAIECIFALSWAFMSCTGTTPKTGNSSEAEIYRLIDSLEKVQVITTSSQIYLKLPTEADITDKFAQIQENANCGVDSDQFIMGYCYFNGYCVEKDIVKAIDWYTKAAEQGIKEAETQIGLIYYLGDNDIDVDYELAMEWLNKAAQKNDAMALYNLGVMYDLGKGVPVDKDKGIKYYIAAASGGDTDAMYNLACSYEDGDGVKKNQEIANKLYLIAAEAGDAEAMNNLAYNYANGIGFKIDEGKAMMWLNRAAHKGCPSAKRSLDKYYISIIMGDHKFR